MNSRKQETSGGDTNNSKILQRATTSSSTTNSATVSSSASRQSSSWAAGFKNPRIVRVSRTFGGKDRHSKVCTVKGLRDRRIRLSVPTAIQLYDLQDRLGLSQPSKVVDWLIDATKNEIDKLPPLQMPPPSLSHFFNHHQDIVDANNSTLRSSETGFATNNDHHFFQSPNLGMLNTFNNNTSTLISHNWEPNSNLSLGPFGNYHSSFSSSSSQDQCPQQQNNMSFPSLGFHHHQQLYFCPTSGTTLLSSLGSPYSNNSQLNPNSLVPTLQLISTPVNDNNKGINLQDPHQHNHKEGTGS